MAIRRRRVEEAAARRVVGACDTATGVSLLRQAFSTAWGVDPKPRAAARIEARQDARSILYPFVVASS